MINLSVKKSKRFEQMLANDTWLMKLFRNFAINFEKQWSKEAGSDREWIKNGTTRTRNFGKISIKPHPTKLTVRSGRLIAAATGKSGESLTSFTTRANGFEITKILTVPYANRQEKQLGGQRAYMFPAGEYVYEQMGEKILQKSINESLK